MQIDIFDIQSCYSSLFSFAFLSYILLFFFYKKKNTKISIIIMIITYSLLSIRWNHWSLFQWLRLFNPNPSFISTQLILLLIYEKIFDKKIVLEKDWLFIAYFGCFTSLSLYPLGLGMTLIDPYKLGWFPIFWLGIAIITSFFLLIGQKFGIMLTISFLCFFLHIQESNNFWDSIVDPIYGFIALIYTLILLYQHYSSFFLYSRRIRKYKKV